jgi:hypothetical protein
MAGSSRGGGENHRWRGIEELAPVVFTDAKYIETYLVSKRNCFEQLAEMSFRIDGPTGRVNGCRYETVYTNLHLFLILVFKTRIVSRDKPPVEPLRFYFFRDANTHLGNVVMSSSHRVAA